MLSVNERIAQLRKLMKEHHIDVYYIPNGDDHISAEYVADYFKCKSYISGFSGDSGSVVVTEDFAGLWTDGRYFTQAEKELAGTEVELMRMGQEGVKPVLQYVIDAAPENGVVGFDGKVVSASSAMKLREALAGKNATLAVSHDLVDPVWGEDRPEMPQEKIYVLPQKFTGESPAERIERVREEMKKNNADALFLSMLEDPCWLLNVRGDDIACTPVAYAFAMVTMDSVTYYIDEAKLHPEVKEHFRKAGVTVKSYESVADDFKALKDCRLWAERDTLNAYLYSLLDASVTVIDKASPVVMFRACKNETEIRNLKKAHIRDGVAMVRFLYWLKSHIGRIEISEISAENKLYELRAEGENYLEPSFPTISAYRGNAAMMHYSASEESNATLHAKGFLLVDSGGTYADGTTDITRTIALGKPTKEEKKMFTKVLQGVLRLTRAHFLYGTTGNNLDILARGPMWDMDIDYQCGTGHGVGHVLGVHEGPHGIRWGMNPARPSAVLEEGMVVTNEPGVYLPDVLGIRTENELLVVKGKKNFYGQFMHFETITFCPIDRDAIDPQYLEDSDLAQLNSYHAEVYKKLSPYLEGKELVWLEKSCAEITR